MNIIVPESFKDHAYRAEILSIVQAKIDEHPRSHQAQIGPSEVGGCMRKVAFKLAYGGDSDEDGGGGWAASRGTLIHAWLDETFKGADRFMPDGSQRFFSDLKLPQVNPNVAGGTLDLYDLLNQTVIDWKCPGDWTMRSVRNATPSVGYYVQAMLYGRGLEETGYPVTRVCLAYLPACGDDLHGTAKGAVFHFWPYDRSVTEVAFASVQRIRNMLDVAPTSRVLEVMETRSDFCGSCACFVGSKDRRAMCPGAENLAPMKRVSSNNPFAK